MLITLSLHPLEILTQRAISDEAYSPGNRTKHTQLRSLLKLNKLKTDYCYELFPISQQSNRAVRMPSHISCHFQIKLDINSRELTLCMHVKDPTDDDVWVSCAKKKDCEIRISSLSCVIERSRFERFMFLYAT